LGVNESGKSFFDDELCLLDEELCFFDDELSFLEDELCFFDDDPCSLNDELCSSDNETDSSDSVPFSHALKKSTEKTEHKAIRNGTKKCFLFRHILFLKIIINVLKRKRSARERQPQLTTFSGSSPTYFTFTTIFSD
jgi:hypothetical protein